MRHALHKEVNEDDLHCPKAFQLREELIKTNASVKKMMDTIMGHTAESPECIGRLELYGDSRTLLFKIRWESRQELLDFWDYLGLEAAIAPPGEEESTQDDLDDLNDPVTIEDVEGLVKDWRRIRKFFEKILNFQKNSN